MAIVRFLRQRGFVNMAQFQALIIRRWLYIKRSKSSFIFSMIFSIFLSVMALGLYFIMKLLLEKREVIVGWELYGIKQGYVSFISNQSSYWIQDLLKISRRHDKENNINTNYFEDINAFNQWVYQGKKNNPGSFNVLAAYEAISLYPYKFIINYNSTKLDTNFDRAMIEMAVPEFTFDDRKFFEEVMLTKLVWKQEFGEENDFKFSYINLQRRTNTFVFGFIAPMIVVSGLLSIFPLIIFYPTNDHTVGIKDFLIANNINLGSYWISSFLSDLALWIVFSLTIWVIFLLSNISIFTRIPISLLYSFLVAGPGLILFVYILSFFFESGEGASSSIFIIMVIPFVFPFSYDIIRKGKKTPEWIEWVWSMIPQINFLRFFTRVLRSSFSNFSFKFFWSYHLSVPNVTMQICFIPIFSLIIWIIERKKYDFLHKKAKSLFKKKQSVFEKKVLHYEEPEVTHMIEYVESSKDLAIIFKDVYRLYFNSQGEPIPAVNDFTLGINNGSVFGLLGPNGAGKSSIMKMLLGYIPPSSGSILVNGYPIQVNGKSLSVSVCPQFDSHLFGEMTPKEHFDFYAPIYKYDVRTKLIKSRELMALLSIDSFSDRLVREMSGGQKRKLSVALAFYSPSTVVVLDEPTSSLDPMARKCVHDLILRFKGRKTIVLSTHLLSEAESLCDHMAIMIKGSVYTCGTTQHLLNKFGKMYKIETLLLDENIKTLQKCKQFFSEVLPEASLLSIKPKSLVYTIDIEVISISELFEHLQSSTPSEKGFSYFSCTTSSLESAYLEILKKSSYYDESMEFLEVK